MTNDIKQLAPKFVQVIATEIANQAKTAQSVNSISIKTVKEKFVKMLMEEINKALPDNR